MKTVILAGGEGTRLYPVTKFISKQLLPLCGKPLIYYPLSLAMLSGSKEVAIITQSKYVDMYNKVLGDGSDFGISITYITQDHPDGLASAMYLAKDFIGDDMFLFLLGDNFLYGHGLPDKIINAITKKRNTMFSYKVEDPKSFGVIVSNDESQIIDIEEKPANPKSKWASVGVYVFEGKILKQFPNLSKSRRGEYELPDLVKLFMGENKVYEDRLGRGFTWFDTGTISNFLSANNFIHQLETSTNSKIGCLEEIAIIKKMIGEETWNKFPKKGEYYEYIWSIIDEG